jgi:hypothetical protein
MRASTIMAALALAVGCDGSRPSGDAGVDADLPDPSLVDIPWLAAGDPPLEASPEHACPEGFRTERTDTGIVSCRPWPEGGPADCAGPEAHFPGEPGCARVGTPCPSGEWPEELPTDRSIVYVREGGAGDGTQARPYGSIGLAVSRAPVGAIVAAAKGTYEEPRVDLFSDVTVWGACPEETILTSPVVSEEDTLIGAFLGDGELRNVTVRAPGTMGIYVAMGVTVRIEGVVIDAASGYGMYISGAGTTVSAEDVIVRDVTSFPSGDGGSGVQVIDGASMTMRRASIERSDQLALTVAYGSTGTFERVALRDSTGAAPVVRSGTAMAVQEDGVATLTASAVWGHPRGGLLSALRSSLTVRDVAIEEIGAIDEGVASGLEVRVGSTLDARFVYIERARGGAVVASEDGAYTLEDLVVRNTQPASDFDLVGTGMSLEGESSATLRRALFEGNHRGGIVTRPTTRLTATDLVVRDTRPSGARGLGVGITLFGAENVIERAIIDRATLEGVGVSGEGATAILRDIVIRDTRGEPALGVYGRGLEVNLGASLTAERVLLERNREVSLFVVDPGSTARITDLLIRDSLGQECGEGCPEGQQYGYGMTSRDGGAIDLTGFVVTRSRLLGLQVGEGATLVGARGEVSAGVIGINIQEPAYDLATSLADVAFEGNERNVDSMFLPLPNTGLGDL